jgi:hypothetical protein
MFAAVVVAVVVAVDVAGIRPFEGVEGAEGAELMVPPIAEESLSAEPSESHPRSGTVSNAQRNTWKKELM